jgi:hypothetical protein
VDKRCGVGDEGKWRGIGTQGNGAALGCRAASLRRAAEWGPRATALEGLAMRRPRAGALRMQGRAWISAKLASGEAVLLSGVGVGGSGSVGRRCWRGWRRWAAAVRGSGGVRGSWAAGG